MCSLTISYFTKKLVDICNDFIFCKVMQEKGLLRELLKRILPDLNISILNIVPQKVVNLGIDVHGVRFDLFCLGRHVYTFQNLCCESPELQLGDGSTKIVLNANGMVDDISSELRSFLDYVAGKGVHDCFIEKLDKAVRRAKMDKEVSLEYIRMNMWNLERQEIGEEKGAQEEKKKVIMTMLKKGKTPEEITDLCEYPIELVNEVRDNMLATS